MPTLADQSERPVVVYDGQCPFCLKQVEKMRRRDDRGAFEYVPRQDEGLEARFPKLAEGDFNTGMRLVVPEGPIHVGADAVYHIARELRGWRLWAWLYRVPGLGLLCRVAYAWVAKNRQRLAQSCEDGACETISPVGGPIVAPDDIAFDSHDVMYVTEVMSARVSARSKNGDVRVIADNVPAANGITVHQDRVFMDECRPGGRLFESALAKEEEGHEMGWWGCTAGPCMSLAAALLCN